jgi:hypothetical protein
MPNLTVAAAEYEEIQRRVSEFGSIAELRLLSYLTQMDTVQKFAIVQGVTAENLAIFVKRAQELQGMVLYLVQAISNALKHHVEETDKKDEGLY